MRDNGLSPGNKQGGQVCAQGGGGGEHTLLGPAPKASRPRHRAEHRVCVLVGEGRFRGTGSGNQHILSKTKVLAVLGGPLGVWGLARLEQKESLMVAALTQKISV